MRKPITPTLTVNLDRVKPGPRSRTLALLLDTAMNLVSAGKVPSVSEVAAAAKVSRATAYRYFPTRSALIASVVDVSLGPVRSWSSTATDGEARLHELFEKTFPRFRDFEAQLRAALQLSQEHWLLANAGELKEEQFRRGHRMLILDRAAAPLKKQMSAASYTRLLQGLSIVFGIEPYVVLKDMWNASDKETFAVTRWIVEALVRATLADAAEKTSASRKTNDAKKASPAIGSRTSRK
jgi:AcrR family transcriptional regulator